MFYSTTVLTMKNRIGKICRMSIMTLCVISSFLLVACNLTKDDYYARPDWLEAPVYDILKSKNNFSLYLQCIDKTPYAQVLKGAGNYTVFAPNDSAFRVFMSENSYTNVDAIPVDELKKIVGYTMVFNRFAAENTNATGTTPSYLANLSYLSNPLNMRRKTSYYKTIYQEKVNGVDTWVVDWSKEKVEIFTPYRYIPILSSNYFQANSLGDGSVDYSYFYPNVPYKNLQVLNSSLVTKDMFAENGVVHEVNAVPYAAKNLDEMLKESKDGYADMKAIFDISIDGKPFFVNYAEDKLLTEKYKKIYPDKNISQLFTKSYQYLPYSLNNESYASAFNSSQSDAQNGYSLIVPSKAAIDKYFADKILNRGYATKADLPVEVLAYFLKAHMMDEIVWPSGYHLAQNSNGEFFNGIGSTGKKFAECGVVSSRLASNGVLYQTNEVIKSKYFETVFSEILLNPKFQLLKSAMAKFYVSTLVEELLKSPLTGYIEENYTIILPTDQQLAADGFTYDNVANLFDNSNLSTGDEDRLRRIIRSGIFRRVKNNTINTSIPDFIASKIPTQYAGYGYAVNDFGDLIRYKDNKIQAIGNQLDNQWVTLTKVGDFNNGVVYTGDQLLQYSPRATYPASARGWNDETLYQYIVRFVKTTGQGKSFLSYLERSILNKTDGKLTGIPEGGYYTILIPSDAILSQAKNSIINKVGVLLPDTSTVLPTNAAQMQTAQEFVQSCFLSGSVLPDDGQQLIIPGNISQMSIPTMMRANAPDKGILQEKTYMTVYKNADATMTFSPKDIVLGANVLVSGGIGTSVKQPLSIINRTRLNANTPYYSNFMGPRAVIHVVNNYHWFKIN